MREIKFREIKFRGKDFFTGKWVFGSLIKNEVGDLFILTDRGDHRVVSESVGQFTGITDKNGVEIYEGDIMESAKNKYLVLWNKDTASFFKKILPIKGVECYSFVSAMLEGKKQIIGNIYENSELL